MALMPNLLILFIVISFAPLLESKLTVDYYKEKCPQLDQIVQDVVTNKQIDSPTTAAGTLRLFFHDCMVDGCDASVLITSNRRSNAERNADINLSLSGDGFDLIVRIKTALELSCPGIVSCADILALATRNLVKMVGGPFYEVRLGRKDGLVSDASRVEPNLPRANTSFAHIIEQFTSKGFTIKEIVTLSGAHTIGFSHCKEFTDRIFNFKSPTGFDPTLNPSLVNRLRQICADYKNNTGMAAFNDVMTPGKFDNMYFVNLKNGLGLLASDTVLYTDPRTQPFVELYANNQQAFFDDFAHAMEKMSLVGVKVGNKGEVRSKCDSFNNLNT